MMMMTLETERLLLRPLELRDAPVIQGLADHHLVAATTMNIPHPYPPGAAADWIRQLQQHTDNHHTFGIVLRPEQTLMGAVSIHREPDSRAELGYWLGVPYWNQGYMSEAVRRMIQYGFEHMQLNRVFARYLMTNPASGRVMQKAGMTYEGVMRKHTRKGDQFHDLAYYSILRSEFYAG